LYFLDTIRYRGDKHIDSFVPNVEPPKEKQSHVVIRVVVLVFWWLHDCGWKHSVWNRKYLGSYSQLIKPICVSYVQQLNRRRMLQHSTFTRIPKGPFHRRVLGKHVCVVHSVTRYHVRSTRISQYSRYDNIRGAEQSVHHHEVRLRTCPHEESPKST